MSDPWNPVPERISLAGTDLNALLFRPPGQTRRSPAVLSVPGGGLSPEDYDWLHLPLSAAGFVVLAMYQRGFGSGAERDPTTGPRTDYAGPIQQRDALGALEVLAATPGVDPNRLGMVGHSLGAFVTLIVAGRTERLRAVSALSTVADMAVHVQRLELAYPDLYHRLTNLCGGPPDPAAEGYRIRSPIAYVAGVRAAVQLVTGANDAFLPSYALAEMVQAFARQGTQCEQIVVPNAAHFFEQPGFRTQTSHTAVVAAHVLRWFLAHVV
jgi:dipeptidyl aminopeptidase/acylaminoacyl peptidase